LLCCFQDIPATGSDNMTVNMPVITKNGITDNFSDNFAWWIPDDGTNAIQLPASTLIKLPIPQELIGKSGWLWYKINSEKTGCSHGTLKPDWKLVNEVFENRPAPQISIYLPINANDSYPGNIILIGEGNLKSVVLTINSTWKQWKINYQQSNFSIQIPGVPPGKYQVQVNTTRGIATGSLTVTDEGGWVMMLIDR